MINLISNNIYNIIYLFTFYSFGGWCLEVSYYFKNERRFVNRGFLKGPFCPIYGCCIVTLIFILEPYKNNIPLLFLSAFFFTSFLEYITGFLLEKTFNSKWWDYSDDPLNIHGRVCLPYSLIWATGEVIIITIINPIIINVINKIPYFLTSFLFYFIVLYFLFDFSIIIFSLLEVDKLSKPFEFVSLNASINKVTSLSNFYIKRATYKLKSFENTLQKLKFNDRPYKQYNILIKHIKEKIKKY